MFEAEARKCFAGRAYPLIRGWYSVRRWTDANDWNRLAARAAYLHFDGRAMVSHQSALVWHNLPVHYAPLDTVHLTRTGNGSSRHRPQMMLHRAVFDLEPADRVPIAHAIVQGGITGEPLTALIAADAALHAGRVSREVLRAAMGDLRGLKGLEPVRAILGEADARVESPGESILGHRLRQLGWEVEPQFLVMTDQGPKYADFLIKGTNVLAEFDGLIKYRGADGAAAVVKEKAREDAMRRRGFRFARFVWSEGDDLDLIGRRVHQQVTDAAA